MFDTLRKHNSFIIRHYVGIFLNSFRSFLVSLCYQMLLEKYSDTYNLMFNR